MKRRGAQAFPDAEAAIIVLRWLTVAFASVQTVTYYRPFPAGVEVVAWVINGTFALAAAVLTAWWLRLRARDGVVSADGRIGIASLVVDSVFVSAVTWVYAFDPETAIFAILYVVPIEGAYRFGLRGALGTMAVLAVAYAARDAWASARWGVDFLVVSITFRMGVGLLIAAIAGAMAQRARREHARLQRALQAERDAGLALRSLDELRSTFLAAVSHELRTPLTSILGFTITIRERDRSLDPQTREMLDIVLEQAQRLQHLLEDLLDIERMGRGGVTLDRHEVDVAAIARRRAREVAASTGRQLVVDADPARGIVDAAKVERLVDNLIGNAVKYSPESAQVDVHVQRSGEGVLLWVEDGGPGVPEGLRSSIFAPFERGALTSVHMPGTGIGLSLVDRFARLHGGRAWVEERADRAPGASFRVWLPDGPEGTQVVTVAHEPWGSDSPVEPS